MRRSIVVILALLAAACGGPGPTTSPSESGAPLPSIGLDPGVLGLTCGDDTRFHPALLAETGRAETESDPAALALRAYLASTAGRRGPAAGWVRIAQLATRATFIAPHPDGSGWVLATVSVGAGGWQVEDTGSCTPEVALPAGVSRAELRFDPAFPAPAPEDTVLHLLINERACSGGVSPEGRVRDPIVAVTTQAVTIAILVDERPGGNDCPGNPDFAVEVELPEAIGSRAILDGAQFPPQPIALQPA